MKLKPGCEVEYEKRHRAIWPELVKLLKETGVSEYSIFWDKETNLLFAVQEQAATAVRRIWVRIPSLRNGGITWPTSWTSIPTIRRCRFP